MFTPPQRFIIIGYGTIGKCVLDLLLLDSTFIENCFAHPVISQASFLIIDSRYQKMPTHAQNVEFLQWNIKKENLRSLFEQIGLNKTDIIIDLTNGISTVGMLRSVASFSARYINTAVEGWGGWGDMPAMISRLFSLQKRIHKGMPSMLISHGMNPGMVSHFLIEAMKSLTPKEKMNLSTVHITEVDTQKFCKNASGKPVVAVPKLMSVVPRMPRRILSTWGPQNFVDEMTAPPILVKNGRNHNIKSKAYLTTLNSCILSPEKKSMVPYEGNLVTHEETFTMNRYLQEKYALNPTVVFVYRCTESSYKTLVKRETNASKKPKKGYLIKGAGLEGYDTVGVYLDNSYSARKIWMGNVCRTNYAANDAIRRQLHNATTMQVAAGVLAGLYALMECPNLGLLFPENVPEKVRKNMIKIAERYFGPVETIVW